MAHLNFNAVMKQFNVACKQLPTCDTCLQAKTTRQPLPYYNSLVGTAKHPGEMTHVDIAGPFKPGMGGGATRYIVYRRPHTQGYVLLFEGERQPTTRV
jgi:hypothetical protein